MLDYNNTQIFNLTPHSVTLQLLSGEVISVEPDGTPLAAKAVEKVHSSTPEVTYVTTEFVGTDEGNARLDNLERDYPGAIVIGNIIAAQAYPGRVVAMVPVPGFERVPPDQKRMMVNKFTVFAPPAPTKVVYGARPIVEKDIIAEDPDDSGITCPSYKTPYCLHDCTNMSCWDEYNNSHKEFQY
jgi:hypothetical protein